MLQLNETTENLFTKTKSADWMILLLICAASALECVFLHLKN